MKHTETTGAPRNLEGDMAHLGGPPAIPSLRRSLAATTFFIITWLLVFPYFGELNNPNENVRVYMTAALVDHGTYEISEERARWGWVNDGACVEHRENDLLPCEGGWQGERFYYSVKAPLTSFLGIPGYLIAKALHSTADSSAPFADILWWVRLFGAGIPCSFFLFFFYRFLGRLTTSALARDTTFIAFAFGSVFLGYSLLFVSHSTCAAAAGSALMLLISFWRARKLGRPLTGRKAASRAFFAGLFAASATAFEYPAFFVTLLLCVFALIAIRSRHIFLFCLGALLPTLLVAHFQWSAFGNPLTPGHLFVESADFRAGHESGFFGADFLHWDAVFGLLFGPREGLFTTSPIFVFALLGITTAYRRGRGPTVTALIASALSYLAICFMNNWTGGWVIGPRYLLMVYPFVAIATLFGIESIVQKRRYGVTVVHTLLIMSIALSWAPSLLFPHAPPNTNFPLFDSALPLISAGLMPASPLNHLGIYGRGVLLAPLLILIFALAWTKGSSTKRGWVFGTVITCAAVCAVYVYQDQAFPLPPGTHHNWWSR